VIYKQVKSYRKSSETGIDIITINYLESRESLEIGKSPRTSIYLSTGIRESQL